MSRLFRFCRSHRKKNHKNEFRRYILVLCMFIHKLYIAQLMVKGNLVVEIEILLNRWHGYVAMWGVFGARANSRRIKSWVIEFKHRVHQQIYDYINENYKFIFVLHSWMSVAVGRYICDYWWALYIIFGHVVDTIIGNQFKWIGSSNIIEKWMDETRIII